MAAVLGVSAYYHDAAAALVVDGRVVAAMQEERLSRAKHDPSLPLRAIGACLALGNYHNCGPGRSIAPEHVDWDDLEGLVRLLVEAAATWRGEDPGDRMRARLERIWERERGRLESSARRLRSSRG